MKISSKQRISQSLGLEYVDTPQFEMKEESPWFYVIIAIILTLSIGFNLLFSIVKVDGPSMSPKLKDGSFILTSKTESVERFDIVVLKERLVDDGDSKHIVKRVIGMPGDVVTYVNGQLYINNEKYDEKYLKESNIKDFNQVSFTINVPKNHYFVLGDNRDVSKDSRQVGSFKKSAVIGVMVGQ